jgi:hypothetical protein
MIEERDRECMWILSGSWHCHYDVISKPKPNPGYYAKVRVLREQNNFGSLKIMISYNRANKDKQYE